MMKIIAWCLSNIKVVIVVISAIIGGFIYPFAKESVAFVNMGYENNKINGKQEEKIYKLEQGQIRTNEREELMFQMLKEIRDRDYQELSARRRR